MTAYVVEALEEVTLDVAGPGGRLADYDLMSPYVWREGDAYRLMVRVLPHPLGPNDPTGIIWVGDSTDGRHFAIRPRPAITPGPDFDDAGGCEDPTIVVGKDGGYRVFYTGVDSARAQGCLMLAEGPDLTDLTKREVALKAPPGEGNIKEATVVRGSDGIWRLFYEYARDQASRIGVAVAPSEAGPWTVIADPFGIREDGWDNWHLSTGPILTQPDRDPVMFYNGATPDARWRIGWISFAPDYSRVTGRGVEPLLIPPPAKDRTATDIAFAASCVEVEGQPDCAWLYYSLEDAILRRALVRRYN
ncbi:glycosidase [Sphingomonas floccifaciens]|uniref:Glycosidase n=1 Tax=Sphingomonas floccifaciens TaxID=1844115 RepID=A0ABW4NHH6_9SPHN